MIPYKFSNCAVAEKPETEITRLLEKCTNGIENVWLPREAKDKIAEALYGLFGAQSSTYKLHGWAWPMFTVLRNAAGRDRRTAEETLTDSPLNKKFKGDSFEVKNNQRRLICILNTSVKYKEKGRY